MNRNRPRGAARGFTLIELLVVIVILGILAAVVIPRVIGRGDDAKVASAVTTVQAFSNALQMYNADTGSFPTEDQGLQALISNPGVKNWKGPYLTGKTSIAPDPWGNPYIYKIPGSNGSDPDIISLGSDGKEGGEGNAADVNSSKSQ